MRVKLLWLFAGLLSALQAPPAACEPEPAASRVVPNDNRRSAGIVSDGVVALELDARPATWYPENQDDPGVPVFAFAKVGGAPRISGPFLRVPQGGRPGC